MSSRKLFKVLSLILALTLLVLLVGTAAAQEPTAEPTDEATAEPTDEATAEPTDEATAEPTDEATAEPTATITATATITPELVTEEVPISIAAVNPPPQKSYVLVQNLSGSTAHITAQFFTGVNGSSSTPNMVLQVQRNINPNSAINISTDPAAMPEAASIPSPWKGSLVIQSDQAVAATVVNFGSPTAHSIYEGSDSTKISNDVLMPSIHWNPAGQEAVIGIQNTQSSAIQVNLTYFSKTGAVVKGPTAFTIPGNTTLYRNAITDCATCPGGPSGPAGTPEGSARVTTVNSGNKVAVAVIEYLGNTAYAYDGIPATKAGRQFLLPSVHRNPGGQFTFALVQNTGAVPTNVTIQYRNAAGTIVDTKNQSIPGKGSFNFCTAPGCPLLPANMPNEGSAKIISASADVVVSVVETVTGFPSAYNGFKIGPAPSSAKTKQLFPSVHRNPGGQFSFLLVSNPSETTNATCTMVFKSSSTGQTNTLNNRVVPKKGSYNFITVPGAVPADDPTNLGNEGSATLTCNIPVVAVEVEVVLGVPATYEAFGQ